MEIVVSSPPAAEPVSLADAKLAAAIDIADDDTLIQSLITTARVWCENYTNSTFVATTFLMRCSHFPWHMPAASSSGSGGCCINGVLRLYNPPLLAVNSISYEDPTTGSMIVLDPSLYRVQTGPRGRITPVYNRSYPATRHELDSVLISYTCGYGEASMVPEGIKVAIKFMVKQSYYGIRSMEDAGSIPRELECLLTPYVLGWST